MTTTERFVIDTNVLVSFVLLPSSVPARPVRHILDRHEVAASKGMLDELGDVLSRPKFDRYAPRTKRERLVAHLRRSVIVVPILRRIRACTDPTDDKFLEAAVSGGAGTIITGDQALLTLHPSRGIGIITPGECLRRAGLRP